MRRLIIILVLIILVFFSVLGFFAWRKRTTKVAPPDAAVSVQPAQEIKPHPFVNDKDLDGISDAEEEAQGTSDLEFDTDGDGLSDIDEINIFKTSPVKIDTDGDGYTDSWEIMQGYNPNGAGLSTLAP